MKLKGISIFLLLIFSMCEAQTTKLNSLSEQFLINIKKGENTEHWQEQLAKIDVEELTTTLRTDEQKLAFWINIYNAYIQVILIKDPELYEDKSSFFSKDQITMAKNKISFDKIEHGIIRRSQSKIGLGYVKKGFPDRFEKLLRIEEPDYRIHFALNCGAKDCPPIAIYSPIDLHHQLAKSTTYFLKSSTTFDTTQNKVFVSSLFSWFRGDFGGKGGSLKILKEQNLIPTTRGVEIDYKEYNWTLDLGNFIEF